MSGISGPQSERWFSELLSAGLEMGVLTEGDVLVHATPSVLAAALPRDVMVKVLDAALDAGTISPAAVLKTATPDLLAHHVPPHIFWNIISTAARRVGVADGKAAAHSESVREWLRHGFAVGIEVGVLTPIGIVAHVDARVLGTSLPDEIVSDVLEASLSIGKMNAQLVVDTVGLEALVRHVAAGVLWAVWNDAAEMVVAEAGGEVLTPTPKAPVVPVAAEKSAAEKPKAVLAEGSLRNAAADDEPLIVMIPAKDDGGGAMPTTGRDDDAQAAGLAAKPASAKPSTAS